MRYSKAVQLVHEFSGALLCIDVQERAESEGFAMKVVLKAIDPPSGRALHPCRTAVLAFEENSGAHVGSKNSVRARFWYGTSHDTFSLLLHRGTDESGGNMEEDQAKVRPHGIVDTAVATILFCV